MKSRNRIVIVTVMLCLGFSFSLNSLRAQHKNDLLLLQSLEDLSELAAVQLKAGMHQSWRDQGVRKIRIQMDGDKPGTYQELIEMDERGNTAHIEAKGVTKVVSYDRQDRIREIASFQNNKPLSTQYFFYTRKGDLKSSVLKMEGSDRELTGYYNSTYNLVRVGESTKGITTKTTSIEYTHNEVGQLTAMSMPGFSVSYLFKDGKLAQIQTQEVGKKGQMNIGWAKEGLDEVKHYEYKDGDLILKTSTKLDYNTAGIIARQTTTFRDPNRKAMVNNFFYDSFNPGTIAMRGDDWDGGGYGYGTPVIVQWATPELDTRVTDSLVFIRFDLKPGVGQEMPNIKNATLRLNHKLTKREIGNVVLQRKGETNTYFVEENLPLLEGGNTVYLEVETELGKFTSGERIINYKNPQRQINVANLHVLAIGVADYDVDVLDLPHAGNDIQAIVQSLSAQQGKLFGEVKTQVLTDKQATKTNIQDAITRIKGKAAAQDLVLIYFAGQGEEWEGTFYLKPSDVKGERSELSKTAIDNRWILEEISRYSAPALYFLDASHKVAGEGADVGSANLDEVRKDFEDVITSDDEIRIFMSSTSSKQTAKVEENGSIFAKALLEGISGKADEKGNGNGFVTVDELSDYVADRVLDMTSWSQKPSTAKRGIGLVPVAKVK